VVWGTGTPRREFLYVDHLAGACIHLMKTYSSGELVNIGTGEDITIAEFARVVAATVGYAGQVSFDSSRPDGPPKKTARCLQAGQPRLARRDLAEGRHPARLSGPSPRDRWPLS
jgi:nucleoside-diphosphate-sugar epimerase